MGHSVNTEHIRIELKYKKTGSDEWYTYHIAPEVYFDFSWLDEGEALAVDSITVYDDLQYYIQGECDQISHISIDIIDIQKNAKRHFSQVFWNQQNNWILERIDTIDDIVDNQEVIVQTLKPKELTKCTENDYEILRFSLQKESIECCLHSVIHDNADGSQSEILIFPEKNEEK